MMKNKNGFHVLIAAVMIEISGISVVLGLSKSSNVPEDQNQDFRITQQPPGFPSEAFADSLAPIPYLTGMTHASWVRDEMPQTIAWKPQTHPSSLGISDVAITTEFPRSGLGSLRMRAILHGGDDPTSQGEAYIDTRYHNPIGCAPPNCPPIPLNLCGEEIWGWVYCPPGSGGEPNHPNYLQIILHSVKGQYPNETWKDFISPVYNILPGQWNRVNAYIPYPTTGGANIEDEFDGSHVAIISFKVGIGGGSTATFKGNFYLDDVSWGTDGCQPKFDFEEILSSLDSLTRTHVDSVAFVVTRYQDNLTTSVIYSDLQKTTPDDRATATIQELHARGIKVLLKPHVDVQDGRWRGYIDPSDLPLWFTYYREMMLHYADMAQTNGVEMLCIGNEFRTLTEKAAARPYWENLITDIRARYTGLLTYGANWSRVAAAIDENIGLPYSRPVDEVPFWRRLDIAGISAYYPINNERDPSLQSLIQGWTRYQFPLPSDQCEGESSTTDTTVYNWVEALESWQSTHGLPVVFTEIGCCSIDYAAKCPYFYCDPNAGCTRSPNGELQKRYYRAAEQVFRGRSWFKGMFWWTWKPVADRGGLCDTDFTPQNKPLEDYLLRVRGGGYLVH